MLVCVPDMTSHKRKATAHPEGFANAKRRHLNHETTVCIEHNALLTLPLPQQRKVNGVQMNGPIRRQASLNAQIALQQILNESPPTSPVPDVNDAYLVSSTASFTLPDSIPEHAVMHVTPEPTPEPDDNHHTHYAALDDATLSCRVEIDSPPTSAASSDSDTKEVCEQQQNSPSRVRTTKLRKPIISVVDYKKVVLCSPKRPATPMNTCKQSAQIEPSGFVKRMASLNARARVTALIEPERKYARRKPHHVLQQQKGIHDPPVGLKSESLKQESAPHHLHNSQVQPCRDMYTDDVSVAIKSPLPRAYHGDASISATSYTITEVPDRDNAENVPFNSLGLLYNGSTVHPDTRVFLTSEGMLPDRIIPTVVPPKANSLELAELVQNAREQHKGKARKPRAQKVGRVSLL